MNAFLASACVRAAGVSLDPEKPFWDRTIIWEGPWGLHGLVLI